MATQEIPELAREAFDMSKEYLRQETLEPAKNLGRVAGYGVGAALIWGLATTFLGVAGMRIVIGLLPDTTIWQGTGYLISGVVLLLLAGLIGWSGSRSIESGSSDKKGIEE
jgi:hypothetical protein